MTNAAIVVCGHDQMLLKTRECLLNLDGYDVRSLDVLDDVIEEMRAERPELAVVCHTFLAGEVMDLLIAACAMGGGKMLLLCRDAAGLEAVMSGMWRVGSSQPKRFLDAVKMVLADEQRLGCLCDVSSEVMC